MRHLALTTENCDVPTLLARRRRKDSISFVVTFITVLGVTPLLILAGLNTGFSILLGAGAALAVSVAAIRRPLMGFFAIIVCTVVFEQDPLSTPVLTDRLHIYFWPSSLMGIPERPIGVLFLLVLFSLICQRFVKRERLLQGGALIWPFLGFLACVVFAVIYGLGTGGNNSTIILEVRPFWYLFVTYLLAYNLVTQKNQIRAFFWIVIIGAGIKGLQGCYIYFIALHGHLDGVNEIMAHEESFFFVALMLLVIIFRMHYSYRPQLSTALALMLPVIIALVANNRRADYVALGVGFIVAWTLVFLVKKEARRSLIRGLLLFIVLGGAYVAVFAHVSGGIGYPAHAVVSIFSPGSGDPRDASSNLYRTIEDFDLKYTAKQSFPFGFGFGKNFLQPQILPNILSEDPVYLLIPHNTIYWIWMRLGPIGDILFWYLIGSIIVRGCIILRQLQDRYLQTVAIYIVAVTFMEIVVAYADYQLYAFRNVMYLGVLIGVLLRLPALDAKEVAAVKEVVPEKKMRGTRPAIMPDLLLK